MWTKTLSNLATFKTTPAASTTSTRHAHVARASWNCRVCVCILAMPDRLPAHAPYKARMHAWTHACGQGFCSAAGALLGHGFCLATLSCSVKGCTWSRVLHGDGVPSATESPWPRFLAQAPFSHSAEGLTPAAHSAQPSGAASVSACSVLGSSGGEAMCWCWWPCKGGKDITEQFDAAAKHSANLSTARRPVQALIP